MNQTRSSRPLISVIVPVYNVSDYIGACIASLRAQTLTDFECLVIDDGSTDNSAAAAMAAIDSDPRFIMIRQDNRGLSGARNAGLARARGTFIGFVDSDDRVVPDYLQRLWQSLDETGCDWVACAVRFCRPDGTGHTHSAIHGAASLADHPVPRRFAFGDWCDVIRHFPSAWNKLYRATLIDGLRFDEGVWFEDHGFFQQVAMRTDHLLHLPEALYLQTQGRPGQITGSDDDRVFDQFDVLARMRATLKQSTRPGADTAFARIASRLLFERSTILRDPDRRRRFAAEAAAFLTREGIAYAPDWDPEIAHCWALEMAGTLPLSVILYWDGQDEAPLHDSLDALAALHGPAHETLLICPNRRAAQTARGVHASGTRIMVQPGHGLARAHNHGLAQACGLYAVFLTAGDRPHPSALLDWCDTMLRADADFGLSSFRDGTGHSAPSHSGFLDHGLLPHAPPPKGGLDIIPRDALNLEPQIGAKIARRQFLLDQNLFFTRGLHADSVFCISAAVLARRVVHIPWPGIALASPPPGVVRASRHPTALWRAQARLGHDMPAEVAAMLPCGWQKRLFARSLRKQLRHSTGLPRRQRALILTGAALTALRHQFTRQTEAAGLDPSVGPRLSMIFDPVDMLRRSLLARRVVTDPPLDALSTTGAGYRLQHFPLTERGVFRFRADFHTTPYANLSFFGAGGAIIPFHLSVRQAEDLVVCNDYHGGWGVERKHTMTLDSTGMDITIVLSPPHVTVWINGIRAFRFGAPKLRRRSGFRALDKITTLGVQGDIHTLEMLPQSAAPGQILLDPRLYLCIGLTPGQTPDDLRLCSSHDETEIPLFSVDEGRGAVAAVHGHLWRGLPAGAPLRFDLYSPGAAPRVFEIGRAEMAGRLGTLLLPDMTPGEDPMIFTVLEHLRHGGFLADLPSGLLDRARHLAHRVGLTQFLSPADRPDTAPQPPPPDTGTVELDMALAQFIRTHRADPDIDPLALLHDLALPPGPRYGLFLALSEHFSMNDQDFDGFARLAAESGLLQMNLPDDPWSLSALLPFLLCAGRLEDLVTAMQRLAVPGDGWVLTPPLAFVARRAMEMPDIDPMIRENILDAFMAFVDNRRTEYWERIHCHELTRAAVSMLAFHDRASHDMQREIEDFCLRAYGLSRLFWQLVNDSTAPLPPRLATARDRFTELRTGSAPTTLDRALHLFEQAKCSDAPRARREWLGPEWDSGDNDIFLAGLEPESAETLLRRMAYPGGAPLPPRPVAELRSAFPDFYPLVPQAPNFDLQCTVGADLTEVLAHPGSPPDTAWMRTLIRRLGTLAAKPSEYLGFALGLAMVTGLHRHPGQQTTRMLLQDWLITRAGTLTPQERQDLFRAPAVRMTLAALRDTAGPAAEAGADATTDLLHALSPPADLALPAPGPADNAGLPAPSPLFDAIVVVFSCLPNLDTRIPAMRAGWLSQLAALNIPHIVVVGNGDGQRHGDVVHLDAPDDYEGLPQKTLAAIRWVHDNTRFGHMIKIDDDCFLNVTLFFQSLTYRKFDYYGRKLNRAPGQTDRAWHQGKSTSDRARMSLDKSPEPSSYADGGSGYALSRHAMAQALASAESPAGRQLIDLSFMEDKLLGDLLALSGIYVTEEDYRVAIRRRTYRDAIPVASWHNGFFASQVAPVQMVHLDTHHDQASALAHLPTLTLRPSKIWPSFQQARLGYQSNALELVSDVSSVKAACDAAVAVVACMRNEMFMLPHFLDHYRRLGVGAFLIADNCSDDGTLEYLAAQPDVALFSVDTDYKRSHYGVAWQQAMLAAFRIGKWSLVADADELLVWQAPQRETLPELLARPIFARAEAVRVFMLDMYPKGALSQASFASGDPFAEAGFADRVPFLTSAPMRGPFSDQPAWTSALRHRLIPGSRPNLFTAQKLALLRYHPFMRLSEGMHFVGDAQLADRELIFAHFKYTAEFRQKAQTEVARQQHFNDAEEYRKYLALASEGRDVIYDPEVSVPWADSPFVRARLDPS